MEVDLTIKTASHADFLFVREVALVAIVFLVLPEGFFRIESMTDVFSLF